MHFELKKKMRFQLFFAERQARGFKLLNRFLPGV
jgi:hypothetical protein